MGQTLGALAAAEEQSASLTLEQLAGEAEPRTDLGRQCGKTTTADRAEPKPG